MIDRESNLMDFIKQDETAVLLKQREGVHVSLYMPLEREPDKQQTNRIRLKNLIKKGQQQLTEQDFLPPDFSLPDPARFFQPALDLLGNGRFAAEHGRALAIFLAAETERIYYLPLPVNESLTIGPRFHIKPLLPYQGSNGRFYLLTLSQNQVQLWRGAQFELEPLEVPSLPSGMSEALALEDPEPSLQHHTHTGHGDDSPIAYHGHDADKEKKGAVLRYLRAVDAALAERLAGEKAPLIIASVDFLRPIYEAANTYPHLLAEGISGNPDKLADYELHAQVWQIIQPTLVKNRQAAIRQYQEFISTDKTSQSIEAIVPAAAYGRVDTLFIPTNRRKAGRFDPSSGEVEFCPAENFICEDLLNLAAAKTLLHGGKVYTLPPEQMPAQAELAAIFRYAG